MIKNKATAHGPIRDVQRRGGFHGPTPPRRSSVILVTYPGGGSGIPGKMTSGPRLGVGEALEDLGGTTLGHARGAVYDKIFEQSPLVRGG